MNKYQESLNKLVESLDRDIILSVEDAKECHNVLQELITEYESLELKYNALTKLLEQTRGVSKEDVKELDKVSDIIHDILYHWKKELNYDPEEM